MKSLVNSFNELVEEAFEVTRKNGATLIISTDGEDLTIEGDANGAFVLMAISAIADEMRVRMRAMGMDDDEINAIILGAASYDAEAYMEELKERWS